MAAQRRFRVGVDVCHMPRVQRLFQRYGDRFLGRFLTVREAAAVSEGADTHRVAELLASRWAAKEAVFKCLGPVGDGRPRLAFPDVEVVPTGSGAPEVVLHGPAARHAQEQGVQDLQLSLSHDGEYAVAVAAHTTDKGLPVRHLVDDVTSQIRSTLE